MGMTKKEFDKMRLAARDAVQDVWDKEKLHTLNHKLFMGMS